jgi:hypothetical protein
MKKQLMKLAFLAILVVGGAVSASAQVYVNVRPTFAPVARPVAPGRTHVWIDEDWEYRGGRYVPVGGHWVMPPHPGWVWVPGRWVHARRGWQWRPGHWRRR